MSMKTIICHIAITLGLAIIMESGAYYHLTHPHEGMFEIYFSFAIIIIFMVYYPLCGWIWHKFG